MHLSAAERWLNCQQKHLMAPRITSAVWSNIIAIQHQKQGQVQKRGQWIPPCQKKDFGEKESLVAAVQQSHSEQLSQLNTLTHCSNWITCRVYSLETKTELVNYTCWQKITHKRTTIIIFFVGWRVRKRIIASNLCCLILYWKLFLLDPVLSGLQSWLWHFSVAWYNTDVYLWEENCSETTISWYRLRAVVWKMRHFQ